MRSPSDKFDSVQKLLRLKQYEQPPPRYFNELSGRIISRIERGEGRTSWWERFGFDLRPALAAATGVFACGLVIYGVATADDVQPADMGAMDSLTVSARLGGGAADSMADGIHVSATSTNPVSHYGTPIDRIVFGGHITPVSYQFR